MQRVVEEGKGLTFAYPAVTLQCKIIERFRIPSCFTYVALTYHNLRTTGIRPFGTAGIATKIRM